jgi:hypothetical protein
MIRVARSEAGWHAQKLLLERSEATTDGRGDAASIPDKQSESLFRLDSVA